MRRIDAIGIGFGVFVVGGLLYAVLRMMGLESFNAGIWSQLVLVLGLVGWVLTYLLRVVGGKMTYNRQREDYETAFLQKRLDELSPEELAVLQAELASESPDNTQSS
jgi:hypothetical protein